MTILFPRTMPAIGVGAQRFELQRFDYLAPERNGRLGALRAGFPLWAGDWTLAAGIGPANSDEWRAFIASLEGPARLFLGREYGREHPRAYPNGFDGMARAGGGTFDGSALAWSQAITDGRARLSLTGLPAGFLIGPGDYVDFRWTTGGEGRRSLVRTLEDATANGAGALSVDIAPAVPALTPALAVAHLDSPACLMRLAPQTDISAMDRRRVAGARIVALQELLP